MTGRGGLPPRRPDQVYSRPDAGVSPGGHADTFRGHILIISANVQGWYIYSGTPALGNPPEAWGNAQSTHDPYGNPLVGSGVPVVVMGGSGGYIAFDPTGQQYMVDSSGNVRYYLSALLRVFSVFDQATGLGLGAVPGLNISPVSAVSGSVTVPAGLAMIRLPFLVYNNAAPAFGGLTGSWAPVASTDRYGNPVPAGLWAPKGQAQLSGIHPGTTATAETWQALSLAPGPAWTATYARYAVMPFGVSKGMVWVNALLTSGTTTADGTVIATVPAAYAPTTGPVQLIDMASNDEPPNGGQTQHLEVDTAGNIRCYGVAATGKTYYVNAAYPLD